MAATAVELQDHQGVAHLHLDQQVAAHLRQHLAYRQDVQGYEMHHTSMQQQEFQQQYSCLVDRCHYLPLHLYQLFHPC
jgi:hypothetical protein